jgi:hypothetical protein
MAANGVVTPVVDGPWVPEAIESCEDIVDRPECLVDMSHRLAVVGRMGARNPEPVVACFGCNVLFIHRKMIVPLNCQIATNPCYQPDSRLRAEVAPLGARRLPIDRTHRYNALLH